MFPYTTQSISLAEYPALQLKLGGANREWVVCLEWGAAKMARARGEKEEVATAAGKGKGRVDKVSTIVRSCFFPHTDRSIRPVLWVRGTFMAMTTLHSVLVGYNGTVCLSTMR